MTTSPGTHPIAEETLVRIGELYDIENAIRGAPPDRRKTIRQRQAKPKIEALRRWWDKMNGTAALEQHGGGDPLCDYPLRVALPLPRRRHLEIDNNAAERAICRLARKRENAAVSAGCGI
ncbi:Transposase (plasmid) [Sinorhizobium sojae CCBAU 05684]|uniref:Transposase n=1 Tax=Sinorhizobium sojae CCBAU 05684 TaxID=716928 RepID=A0A249PLB3_9HYPH|nr:Transposase [Sinorhizobium sojae CCBAU 05684]